MLALLMPAGARGFQTVRCQMADGFDYPVGKPDAVGYFKARGFWPNGHMGEDWNGTGGGDSDLGAPIYATARGVVVLSEDVRLGWGNCVIIRHIYREPGGKIDMVDSLYGHLLDRSVKVGQVVERGQLVGRMGNNRGMYPSHLHFEIRKNLAIGMNRSKFARDYSNYYSPTAFIKAHRRLLVDPRRFEVPVDTFAPYGKELNAEQAAFAASRGSAPGKIAGGLSIPITRGAVGSSKGGGLPKVSGAPPVEPAPEMRMPAADSKTDFWTRLRSKLSNGQMTDSSGGPPR